MRKEDAVAALLSRQEAVEYLGISERTLCSLTAERQIAYIQHRPGGKMFFRQEDLDEYIQRKRVPTREERARNVLLPGTTLRKRRAVG